jgi:hypothetical protein
MATINFIGGEKGGVGKSVTSRLLAQYYIDHEMDFQGFDTDRSHQSFKRFYEDFASSVLVDSFEGLDQIINTLENNPNTNLIVDLAAQTSAPLALWIKEANLLELLQSMGVVVNFWHVMDDGKDSVELLEKLTKSYGSGPNYILVQNKGRGINFSILHQSTSLKNAITLGAYLVEIPKLYESSMRKIDEANMSFWRAMNHQNAEGALSLIDRQRVKIWLKACYEVLGGLPIHTEKQKTSETELETTQAQETAPQ